MSLNNYKIFVEVTEQKSFARAADRLNLTPSAVSHAVAKLEREYGFPLFYRTSGDIRLTHEGQRILPDIYQILHSEEKLQDTLSSINGTESGVVRIGAFNSACVNFVAQIASSFQKKHSNIEVSIYQGGYADVDTWLNNYTIDFGFVSAPGDANLTLLPLVRDEIFCVTPKSVISNSPGFITKEEISALPFIMQHYDYGVESLRTMEALNMKHPDSKCKGIDDESILAMVEAGMGISFLPYLVLKRLSFDVNIYSFSPKQYRLISLAYMTKTSLSPAAMLMLSHMKEYFHLSEDEEPAILTF